MGPGVAVLDFDRSYCMQLRLQRAGYEWIHLLDLKEVKGYCTMESLQRIRERIAKRRCRDVTLLGSGNYHYVSFLLLAEIGQPFTLVLFDHHSDMMQSPSRNLLSCGSWALTAIERLPLLRKVVLLGLSDEALENLPKGTESKVSAFAYHPLTRGPASDRILAEIPTESVYISIDKDVLVPTDAQTDWGQGHLRLDQVIGVIDKIAAKRKIVGVDICGEYPYSPVTTFSQETLRAARLNERANLLLIDAANDWIPKGRSGDNSAAS